MIMDTNDMETSMIIGQWQTCVEMANSVSQRRDTMNNTFITVNLALIATVTITWNIKSVFVLLAGIVLCLIWKRFIINYKILNEVKFEVIHEIEKKLPVAPFYSEWNRLCSTRKYTDGTKLEGLIPLFFLILYFAALVTIGLIKILT
jgi:hypothetical protein